MWLASPTWYLVCLPVCFISLQYSMIVTVVFAYVHAYRNRGEGYIPPIDSDRAASGERQKLVKWTVHSSHRNWSSELYTLPTETGQVNCTLFPQKLVKWTVHSSHRNWSSELYTSHRNWSTGLNSLSTETSQSNQQNTLQTESDLWAEHSTKRNLSSGLNSLMTETGPVNRTLYRQKTDPLLYREKLVKWTERSA